MTSPNSPTICSTNSPLPATNHQIRPDVFGNHNCNRHWWRGGWNNSFQKLWWAICNGRLNDLCTTIHNNYASSIYRLVVIGVGPKHSIHCNLFSFHIYFHRCFAFGMGRVILNKTSCCDAILWCNPCDIAYHISAGPRDDF